jgi:hypothetical protein
LRGEKRVGGLGSRALPAGGDWIGVKYGASGAGVFLGAMPSNTWEKSIRGYAKVRREEKAKVQKNLYSLITLTSLTDWC